LHPPKSLAAFDAVARCCPRWPRWPATTRRSTPRCPLRRPHMRYRGGGSSATGAQVRLPRAIARLLGFDIWNPNPIRHQTRFASRAVPGTVRLPAGIGRSAALEV
jgi:hypothetical protein